MSALGNHPVLTIARHGPGGARRISQTKPDVKALGAKPEFEIIDQSRLAAEQMRAAGDVHEQAVTALRLGGGIQRHERGVALAPAGDLSQKRVVARLTGGMAIQIRHQRAGVAQALVQPHAPGAGALVQCDNADGVLERSGDDDRRRVRMCVQNPVGDPGLAPSGPVDRVCRQRRQGDRENALAGWRRRCACVLGLKRHDQNFCLWGSRLKAIGRSVRRGCVPASGTAALPPRHVQACRPPRTFQCSPASVSLPHWPPPRRSGAGSAQGRRSGARATSNAVSR